jgi:hypothetical protein
LLSVNNGFPTTDLNNGRTNRTTIIVAAVASYTDFAEKMLMPALEW